MSFRTAMNRSDHQVAAISPRVLRAFRPPSTGSGRVGGGYQSLVTDCSLGQCEQVAQVPGGQFGQPTFAIADHQVGQGLLLLDHVVDLLFEGSGADELAYLNVAPLPDPEGAVGGLV